MVKISRRSKIKRERALVTFKRIYFSIVGCFIVFILVVVVVLFYKVYNFISTIPIKSVVVQGASPYVESTIKNNLIFLKNKPITSLQLSNLTDYINYLPWVQRASVYRNLTGEVIISVIEANPYFLWVDDNSKHRVINTENEFVKVKLNFPIENLILIEQGTTALENSSRVRFLVYKDIGILKQIKKLSFNGYRWDIHLRNGIVIKLPENNMEKAYTKVINANKKYSILTKNIDYVDATTANKLFIKPSVN